MDLPFCEICGEEHATLKTAECAVCDDCFGDVVRNDVDKLLGGLPRCCFPLRARNGTMAMCLECYGTEHSHEDMMN